MLATPELEIARNLPPEGCSVQKPSATRAGWPRITTRISTWSPGCCRAACTSISTMCMPIAAGRTIWATKCRTARARCTARCLGRRASRSFTSGRAPSHPVLIALARDDSRQGYSHRAASPICCARFARTRRCIATPPGTMCSIIASIRRIRWAAGAVSLRLSRCRAPAAFRFHLHGAAAREFLAGRFARPRKGPHLHSARMRSPRTG